MAGKKRDVGITEWQEEFEKAVLFYKVLGLSDDDARNHARHDLADKLIVFAGG